MRSFLHGLLAASAVLFFLSDASAQAPPSLGTPMAVPSVTSPSQIPATDPSQEVQNLQQSQENLRLQQVAMQEAAKKDDTLKKQVDLLQKQIETQQKMILLLQDQMKKQTGLGAPVEKLEALEARSKQAAQRDVEIAQAIDKINEQRDADLRNGPRLPVTLRELFLPSPTNESPLSIYGSVITGYQQMNGKAGSFNMPDFGPYFLLKLNEQFLLQASVDIGGDGSVGLGICEANWFVNDWLTVVAGRSLTPIGYYNERIGHEWINRMPDEPLMFKQVSPLISTDGMQLRGAFYLFGSPVKLEYMIYAGNGVQVADAPGTNRPVLTDVSDLEGIIGATGSIPSYGARIGFWIPEWGMSGGFSTYHNGPYASGFPDRFNLWQVDFNVRKNGFDFRFEYCERNQEAQSFIGNDIRATGMYVQIAYRPLFAKCKFIANSELAFRYSRTRFYGYDQTQLDPTTFNSVLDAPVDRDQFTIGYSYYFSPGMALRFAYEVNREVGPSLNDNMFLVQYVWAF